MLPWRGSPDAGIGIREGDAVALRSISLRPLFTPGRADTHNSYLLEQTGQTRLFTGDALLIGGCGRTDFQNGSTETLYSSIHAKILALPYDTLVYPAHDYQHRHVSTVAQERERNPRLGGGKTLPEFIEIMANLAQPIRRRSTSRSLPIFCVARALAAPPESKARPSRAETPPICSLDLAEA